MSETILSDPKLLTQLKRLQYRQQIVPMALLVLSFLIGFIIPIADLRYISIAMSVIAVAWYTWIGMCHRFKHRIPRPETEELLSPVTGRVKQVKSSMDTYQLKIGKHALDCVEIRCPHPSCRWEDDNLRLDYQGQSMVFRFEGGHIVKISPIALNPGEVIGFLIGSASCHLILPRTMPCLVKPHDICEAGITPLLP